MVAFELRRLSWGVQRFHAIRPEILKHPVGFDDGFVAQEFMEATFVLAQYASIAEPVVLSLGRINANGEALLGLDNCEDGGWNGGVQFRILGVAFAEVFAELDAKFVVG